VYIINAAESKRHAGLLVWRHNIKNRITDSFQGGRHTVISHIYCFLLKQTHLYHFRLYSPTLLSPSPPYPLLFIISFLPQLLLSQSLFMYLACILFSSSSYCPLPQFSSQHFILSSFLSSPLFSSHVFAFSSISLVFPFLSFPFLSQHKFPYTIMHTQSVCLNVRTLIEMGGWKTMPRNRSVSVFASSCACV